MSADRSVFSGATLGPFADDLETLCHRFAQAWQANERPRIEAFLELTSPEHYASLLEKLLRIELNHRQQCSETFRPEDYRARFPGHVGVILGVFKDEQARPRIPQAPPAGVPDAQRQVPGRLGRYVLVRELGKGTFGTVYHGYDEDLRREVAIKVPRPERIMSSADAETYLAEARLLARLEHENIVRVYDFGRDSDGRCYLVSQLIRGTDLQKRLAEGSFPYAAAVDIVILVADALHYAHQHGLIHRDIKPANILLDLSEEGSTICARPVVADFGLALPEEEFGTGPHFVGTPAYMSPEQARSEGHRVDARTDVYSLGVVFYEMLTGTQPFRGKSQAEVLEQVRSFEVRPPRQYSDKIPHELERICLKALAKRATDRYSTARDLADELRQWQRSGPSKPPTHRAAVTETMRVQPVPPPEVIHPPVQVVPKGLRSFDATDADFFLHLLPGPRDREGLPDSIRFWKSRIEETDPDETFSVGLVYGPSGCGKTSFVKAGLLPRLADHVIPVYVEAAAADTEARLLKALGKRCDGLKPGLQLVDSMTALRQARGLPDGKKLLIVLDQFEQWLHAHPETPSAELLLALRQCDGHRIQVLLLVRDDFWMATTRFLHDLEIRLVEGQNSAAVDLFSLKHARQVLSDFGRALGCLSPTSNGVHPAQELFLEQALKGLADEGKIIPVRLSLFAEMVKERSWTPTTLREVGGAEGIGVTFLEETFSVSTAPPEHRLHQKAARAVLRAMLPEPGSDLRGRLHSRSDLLLASGYARRPRDFDDLMHILDAELRLVTPSDPEGLPADSPADESSALAGTQFYQLTHDYLVPALREWLTRKQRETARGRAQLCLAERAALWNSRRENRQLPTWWEWLSISLLTRRRERTGPQQALLRKASWFYLLRGGLVALFFAGLSFLALIEVDHRQEERAAVLVDRLLNLRTSKTPGMIEELASYDRWAVPLLLAIFNDAQRGMRERLHAGLALLARHRDEVEPYLWEQFMEFVPAEPAEFRVVLDALLDTTEADRERLVQRFEAELTGQENLRRQVRAAVVLLHLNRRLEAWTWLEHSADPTRRSYVIHELAHLESNAELVRARLGREEKPSSRRALLLALGEFKELPLAEEQRTALRARLLKWYRDDPDPGLHSAVEWVLRRWEQGKALREIDQELRFPEPSPTRNWFVNGRGQTLVVLPGTPGFEMGSPLTEAERRDIEHQHPRRIARSFAISTKEVTVGEFMEFLEANPLVPKNALTHSRRHSVRSDLPIVGVTWQEAIQYCNWLSEREKIPLDQWCYAGDFLELKPVQLRYLSLTGYRLPTEAEWEYACRAGAKTSRHFGNADELLGHYAWYLLNSHTHTSPVGLLKPNDFGLFDLYGNAAELVNTTTAADYPRFLLLGAADDSEEPLFAQDAVKAAGRVMRGGSFNTAAPFIRSAFRGHVPRPVARDEIAGFRVARTLSRAR